MLRVSWILLLAIAVLVAASGVGVLFAGVDSADFNSSTGEDWSRVQTAMPSIAKYIERLEALQGIGSAGFGVFAAVVSASAYRRAERWAWGALALCPFVLGSYAAVFLRDGAQMLGGYYAGLAGLALLALLLTAKMFLAKR